MALLISFSISCKKSNDKLTEPVVTFKQDEIKSIETINAHLDEFYTNSNKGIWQKIKKWIKAHTGTHLFENCIGNGNCGPCPGICLSIGAIANVAQDNYQLSQEEYNNGYRMYTLTLLNDKTMIISFIHTDDFVYKKNFHIPENMGQNVADAFENNPIFLVSEDINMEQNVANAFEKQSIIIEKGVYPVSYKHDTNGETVISIKSN